MKLSIEIFMPATGGSDNNPIVRVDMKGSLDNNNSHEFDFFVSALITGGVKKILIDIEDLQFIDSNGIGCLIGLTKKLRKGNGEVAVTRYTSQIMSILRPINMERFIQFFPTIEEGRNFLKSIDV